MTAYSAIGEAVRSDRFACFVPQPNPGGVWLEQYGVYNYIHIKPAVRRERLRRGAGAHRSASRRPSVGSRQLDRGTARS